MKKSPIKRTGKPLKSNSTIKRNSKLKKKGKSQQVKDVERAQQDAMWEIFELHWNSKPHICENCNTPIWGENKSLYHHHCMPKHRYKELRYEIDGLMLLCWPCHQATENGYPGQKVVERTKEVKAKYGII